MKHQNPVTAFRAWFAFLVQLAVVLNLSAQPADNPSASGTISGQVSNRGTSVYLEGARVVLQPSGPSTLTGRDGQFELSRVPPGTHTLTISYAGLDTETVTVTVEPGRRMVRDVELTSGVYMLDAFEVPGEREGQAEAIQLQRYAPNVKNVLASDAFGNVADENIGNFLLRIPGIVGDVRGGQVRFMRVRGVDPSMNAVTVDGTRIAAGGTDAGLARAFEMDSFPADLVDTIEITKAPTPDMDADSIGGSIDLKTKSGLNRKGRYVSYKVGTSYNLDRHTFRPQGSFMYSDTVGQEEQLGVMFTSSFSWANRPRDVISIGGNWEPTLETNRPAWFKLNTAGEDTFEHKRGGAGLRLDYRLNPNSTVYVNLMFNRNVEEADRRQNSFGGFQARVVDRIDANGIGRTASGQTASILPGWTDLATDTINLTHEREQSSRVSTIKTYNVHVGGEQKLGDAALDYNLNLSTAEGREQRIIFTPTVPRVHFRFDRIPKRSEPAGARFIQTGGPDITDPANIVFDQVSFRNDFKRDRVIGGQVNFHKPIPAAVPARVKIGGRFRIQDPEGVFNRPVYRYTGPRGAALARFLDQSHTYQPKALRGTMPDLRWFDFDKVAAEMKASPEQFPLDPVATLRNQLINDRRASEAVYATYAMGDVKLGRLFVLGGVRVEETRVEGTGSFQFISPEERARRAAWTGPVTEEENLRRTQAEYGNRRTNKSEYRNVFPGIHFRYEIHENVQARLSYSTGIGRPDFGTIIPRDSVNDAARRVTVNDTSLKPQYADNFDLGLEYYFRPAGLLSANLFLKEIDDFIFSADRGEIPSGPNNGFNGDYAGYTLLSQANGGTARIRGVEISYQQQFSNLPGFWSRFGTYANFTWLQTRGDYGTSGANYGAGAVPGFVPRSGNIGLTYRDHRWTLRGQLNFRDAAVLGDSNIQPDASRRIYTNSRQLVDFNINYRVSPRFALYADIINAFGAPLNAAYTYIPARKRGGDNFDAEIKMGVTGQF